jgi:hypothetical protein
MHDDTTIFVSSFFDHITEDVVILDTLYSGVLP